MKMPVLISLVTAAFLVGCGNKSANSNPAAGNSAPNAAADYVGALGRAQNSAVKAVDTASLNQAIQLFQVDKGRFPKDLNELVQEKLIAKIPDAPYGMKLDYDAASGKVSVVKAE